MCSMCARSRVYWSIKIKAYTYRCENEKERARNTRTRFKFHCISIVQALMIQCQWHFWTNRTTRCLSISLLSLLLVHSFVIDQFGRSKCDQMCEHSEYRVEITFPNIIAFILLVRLMICSDDSLSRWRKEKILETLTYYI